MKKIPLSSVWVSTSSKANRALQFRQVHMTTSAAAFAASRVARALRVGAATQDACFPSGLLARARGISRLVFTRKIPVGFVWIVRFRFRPHFSEMNDSAIRARDSLHYTNSDDVRVSCIDLIFHEDLPFTFNRVMVLLMRITEARIAKGRLINDLQIARSRAIRGIAKPCGSAPWCAIRVTLS
jgi:hypothetical protein